MIQERKDYGPQGHFYIYFCTSLFSFFPTGKDPGLWIFWVFSSRRFFKVFFFYLIRRCHANDITLNDNKVLRSNAESYMQLEKSGENKKCNKTLKY